MRTDKSTIGGLLVVALLIVPAGFTIAGSETAPATPVAAEEAAGPDRQVVFYYFHGNRRCRTCLSIEANALEVVETQFAEEIGSGALVWKVLNYDEPENEHFIKEFGLVSASLVVVEVQDGERVRFDVLQRAWSLARDEWRFDQYVHQSVLEYLGSAG